MTTPLARQDLERLLDERNEARTADFAAPLHDRIEAGDLVVVDRVHEGAIYCPPEKISFGVLEDGVLVQVNGPPARSSEWSLARVEARLRVPCEHGQASPSATQEYKSET